MVVEAPDPGLGAEDVRPGAQRGAQRPHQRGAALQPFQRIARPHLEGGAERGGVDPRQALRIGAQRMRRIAREEPGGEGMEAGHGQALGAGDTLPVLGEGPVRPGPGVEQHADDAEIEADAGDLLAGLVLQHPGERAPAVAPAGGEMPPARMIGDGEVRVVVADHRRDIVRRHVQPFRVQPEMRQGVTLRQRQHGVSPPPDRRRVAQQGELRGGLRPVLRRAHSCSPRPLVMASSAASGTLSVK